MIRFVSRREWGAIHGRGNPTAGAKLHLYVHHAAGRAPAATFEAEAARVRQYEEQHARNLTPKNPRIGYTDLFGQSGNIYEGCGVGFIGAHTGGRNSSAWGVCMLLDGRFEAPSPAMIESYLWWRKEQVRKGSLHPRFDTLGHRDSNPTTCPGDLVYSVLVAGITTPEPPLVAGESAILPMPTLRRGSGGASAPADLREAVRELQRRLRMPANLRTGFFFAETEKWVRAHQRRHGLVVDGIVGMKTWATLPA